MQRPLFAVVVDAVGDRHTEFVAGLRDGLTSADADLLVVVSHPLYPRRGKLLRELASSGRLAGAVLTRMHQGEPGVNRAAAMVGDLVTIPLLTYDFQVPDVPHVGRPRAAALDAGLAHLRELGRARVAVLTDLEAMTSMVQAAARADGSRPRLLPLVRGPDSVVTSLAPVLTRRADGSAAFDGLVATDDDLALAAMTLLSAHGLRVPDDVAVVGAGDTEAAARHEPSLTSVHESLRELGAQTAQLLIRVAQANTLHSAAARNSADITVTVRASTAGVVPATPLGLATTVDDRPAIRLPSTSDPRGQGVLVALGEVRARYFAEVVGGTLPAADAEDLQREFVGLVDRYPDPVWWAAVLDALHRDIALNRRADPVQDHRADAVAAQIELVVERALGGKRANRDRAALAATRHLLDLVQALSHASEPTGLFDALTAYLPRIRLRSCLLARPAPPVDGLPMVDLVFRHRDGRTEALDARSAPYPARRLVPERFASDLKGGAWMMQPLFEGETWLGFLLTEQTHLDQRVAEALRRGVSRALADIERGERLTVRAQELEVAVAARTAELRYEAATRQAAQEALSAANVKLREAMLLDSLTQLQNRASLESQAELVWDQHTADGTPLSVLMVDVDHFKAYNDRYGHVAGDECLRSIARCLTDVTRRSGDFVARYGGEEFVVLMPSTETDGAARVADQLLAAVRGAGIDHGDGVGARVTVSIGAATSSSASPFTSMRALFTASDQALYQAKERGRNRSHAAPARRGGISADPVHPAEGVLGAAVLHVDQRPA